MNENVPDPVEVTAQRLHRLCVHWGGLSRSGAWAGLDEPAREYWRGEARKLLADAAPEVLAQAEKVS